MFSNVSCIAQNLNSLVCIYDRLQFFVEYDRKRCLLVEGRLGQQPCILFFCVSIFCRPMTTSTTVESCYKPVWMSDAHKFYAHWRVAQTQGLHSDPHGNSKIVLGWVTLLALDFRCALPPVVTPNHSNHVGERLSTQVQGLSLKGSSILQWPSNSYDACFRITRTS
jgi:hypothetical protein